MTYIECRVCLHALGKTKQPPYLAVAFPTFGRLSLMLGHGGPRLLLQHVHLHLMVLDQAVLLTIVLLEKVRPLLFVLQLQLHHLIGRQERDFQGYVAVVMTTS